MRPRHTQHILPTFPIYSAAFLSPDELVLGGGGGASKTGVKNKLRLYGVNEDRSLGLKDEFELEKGEDVPMSMTTHAESQSIVCGINSVLEKLEKGENENCRVFNVTDTKIKLLATQSTLNISDDDALDCQKVTVLSPDGTMLAVAGSHDLTVLSYPSLRPISQSLHTHREIYDATFSGNMLVVGTTHNLLVYKLPESGVISPKSPATSSPKKGKKKAKAAVNGVAFAVEQLELEKTVDLPSVTSEGSTFRAVRYHPLDTQTLYTVINTVPPRGKKTKSTSRQAFVCKWNTITWTVEKMRKIGDRGVTTFDISADGRFLGFGSSDLAIGMLDSKTLSPLMTILKAHEFPSTTIKFNSTTTLLVSGSADNSIRIVSIPADVGGSTWGVIMLLLITIFVVLLAVAAKQYLGPGSLKW